MKITFAILVLTSCFAFAQNQDVLLQKNLTLKTANLAAVIQKTENNIKVFADNFNVRLDKKAKITSPKEVIGPILQPVLKVSIRKCVLVFCQTIDLDAEFTLKKTTGTCTYNYELAVDLQRSSPLLTDLYSHINTSICIQKTTGGATATLKVNLLHAPTYDEGTVQRLAFEFISLQGESLLESFKTVMKLNGVTEIL